jgi:phosphate uptake regulator
VADLDDIRARLESIAEELGDAALGALREAVEAGADKRPELERRLTRARSAVEKAVHLLGE